MTSSASGKRAGVAKREREAYARGDQIRRYTWGDVFNDPSLMMAELIALLLPD